jgi:ATP-dependent DNA helicase RecG
VPIRAAKLEALGVLTNYQGKVVATNAGVILFGQDGDRRRYFRDARVEGARFAGSSRAADIEDIFDPEEVLINAVAHTDYSKSGETIKAFVYDDRIEIHNPGPMLPGTTTDDIREGRSKIRNRGIASVLRRIRYMERFGTAWEKIGQEVDRDYPEPLLDGDGPVFTATIWPHSSFAHLSKDRRRSATVPHSRKNREEDIIDFLRRHPPARAAEIARHIGVSSRQTRTYLKRLEHAQRVQGSEGPIQHPDRTYRLFPGV